MKNKITILVFLSIFTNVFQQVQAQKSKPSVPDIEKIYLHTDRSQYTLGENLWYKAYVVYAYNHMLFDHSKLLHVELISSESKIVSRHITKIDQGLGHGDFMLTDSIGVKPGKYQLRAYSNWNRNFGDNFVFKKDIEVIDLREESEITKVKAIKQANKLKEKTLKGKLDIDVHFFPEGGSLVHNVFSVVAFKATDEQGFPIDVQGTVFDDLGNKITLFKSRHDGMGKFPFKPLKERQYYAEIIKPNNKKLNINLPEIQPYGYVLSLKKSKTQDFIAIKTNTETLEKNKTPITLIGTTRGITYFEGEQELQNTEQVFMLPKENFPDGIAQITLYDEALKPYSERLVYIEKNHDLNIEFTTDKKIYGPKEKVKIKLTAKTNEDKPVLASYSIAASEKAVNRNNSLDIASYFLMQSDIKGKIHNPQYYFNAQNPRRLQNLDLLLLTQGWRDFLWKKIPEPISTDKFKIEKEIAVIGHVKNRSGKKIKTRQIVKMVLAQGENVFMDSQEIDKNGNFLFNNLTFKGYADLLLNTRNIDKTKKSQLKLTPLFRAPIKTQYDGAIQPQIKIDSSSMFKKHILKKYMVFNYQDMHMLDEIVLTAPKKKKKSMARGRVDRLYVIDERTPHFSSVSQLLQFNIPGLITFGNSISGVSIRFARFSGPPLFILDGVQEDVSTITSLNTDDIDRIESITSAGAAAYGSRGGNGVILVYTKEGSIGKRKDNPQVKRQKIQGYHDAREFYSPNYETSGDKPQDADIRNTLYWNPYLHPDKNGDVECSFFNSEVNNTQVDITVEGITSTGIPIVVKSSYSIDE